MKLSEAIRLGAMLKPPSRGGFMGVAYRADGSCALKAAGDALGFSHSTDVAAPYPQLRDRFRWLDAPRACHIDGCTDDNFDGRFNDTLQIVYHLNDHHHWTREQIADWVATVEPADATSSEPLIETPATA